MSPLPYVCRERGFWFVALARPTIHAHVVGVALPGLAIVAVVVAMEELRRAQVAREQKKGIAIRTLPVRSEIFGRGLNWGVGL